MKLLATLCFLLSATQAFAAETVSFVDLDQYAGRWYQIARNPLWFEPRDCTCTQQTLTAREDGVIDVFNSCTEGGPDGELRTIRGTATNDDPETNAKFTVDFNQPFKGSYWIIGLDEEYRWAVVTDRREYSLYILSKTPELDEELYNAAVAKAAEQLDTDKLLITSHEGCTYPEMEEEDDSAS